MANLLPRLSLSQEYLRQVPTNSISSALVSTYICLWILTISFLRSDQFLHWFVIPVLLCGILIGTDFVDWLRGRLDIFDPIGIIGLLGFHFFFIAPLLHVLWDHWTLYQQLAAPPDWRDWLGSMAVINTLGLIAYRVGRNVIIVIRLKQRRQIDWYLDRQRFFRLVGLSLLGTCLLQVWVYARFGGLSGYIQTVVEAKSKAVFSDPMQGMTFIFMFSESFPILALIAFAVYVTEKKSGRSWLFIGLALILFSILKILFGGLTGGRSLVIWGLFWAVGIVHFWLRPISRKLILAGCAFLIVFMYFTFFYRYTGIEGVLQSFESPKMRSQLEESYGYSLEGLIVGDLGRSDLQAFMLYRLLRPENDYEYALGRTYIGAVARLIPRSIAIRPPTKVKEGVEIQFGKGSYDPEIWWATKVYGLAGETMLNFGPIPIPIAFLIWGLVVGSVKHLMMSVRPTDSRLLLLPFLVNLCFVMLIADSDDIIFFLFKFGTVPFVLLALASVKMYRSQASVGSHC